MPDQTSDLQISIAGQVIDPLMEQNRQDKDDGPIDPKRVVAWIIQFASPLDAAAISDLRTHSSLKLTEYLPPRCYVESLSGQAAKILRDDPRVRAVVRMTGDLKVAAELPDDAENDEPAPPSPTDVIVLDSADADVAVAAIRAILPPDGILAVINDRDRGGVLLVRVNADSATVQRIAAIDAVRFVQSVPETVDDAAGIKPAAVAPFGPSEVPDSVRFGLSGTGQIIGMIDKGPPDLGHCFFLDREHAEPGLMHRKIVAVRNRAGTGPGEHSTFTSGIAAGDDVDRPGSNPDRGVAWDARLVCGNRVDLDTGSLLTELTAAAESGAFVHSNSWHSKPQGSRKPATYDQRSADVDTFSWMNEDHVVLGSSGNTGEEQGPPGSAKNAVCVSATVADGQTADPDGIGDGNGGPTSDGRRKPDITGLGCSVHSAILATPCGTGLRAPCASSYATPWLAAVLTLVRQQLTEGRWRDGQPRPIDACVPTGALLRAIILNSAVARGPALGIPSNVRGWGRADMAVALGQYAPRIMLDMRNADGLNTGETLRLPFTLSRSEPLSATLVWTEPPGVVGSDSCVVNNLDLQLRTPTGDVLLGNDLVDGQMGGMAVSDRINSTEMVVLGTAPTGEWIAEVVASEVNVGNPGQGFALVVTGAIEPDTVLASRRAHTSLRTTPIAGHLGGAATTG